MVAAFPGKDILIGEFGWPSAGRMREGALPSPANQARAIQEVLALAKRENYRVNLIEAYDQPWKRQLEGTVGGHWGLYDAYRREAEIRLGRSGLEPSALALAGGRRGCLRGALVFAVAFGRAPPWQRAGADAGLWLRDRRDGVRGRQHDRLDASPMSRSKASPSATGSVRSPGRRSR